MSAIFYLLHHAIPYRNSSVSAFEGFASSALVGKLFRNLTLRKFCKKQRMAIVHEIENPSILLGVSESGLGKRVNVGQV